MPGVIGKNVIGAATATVGITDCRADVSASCLYTAVAGDVIDQFFFYGNDGAIGGANGDFAVYNFSGGFPVNRVHIPVNVIAASGVDQWWSSVSGLGIALTPGTVYCIAIHAVTSLRIAWDNVANSQSVDTVTSLPAVWSENSKSLFELSMYANVIAGSPPSGVPGSSGDDFDLLFY